MTDCANQFESLKQELRDNLAVIEPLLPNTAAEIEMARYAVDEFCHFDPPATDDALTRLKQTQTLVIMSLNSIWRSTFRRRFLQH